jgi:hypothetical protein
MRVVNYWCFHDFFVFFLKKNDNPLNPVFYRVSLSKEARTKKSSKPYNEKKKFNRSYRGFSTFLKTNPHGPSVSC